MRIALVGFGKMGKITAEAAKAAGHEIVAAIDPLAPGATAKELNKQALHGADVCIDFTAPEAVLDNIKKYCALGVNAVIATTGWYDRIGEARQAAEKSGIGLVYAGNFSIGVNAFYRIVEKAAEIMDSLPEYDVFGVEFHHNAKKDSPSGTAKSIEKILLEKIRRKKSVVEQKLDRKIAPEELHFASVRGGSVPGTHAVYFDCSADTIELKHTARSREGFALGAVKAAEWINGKKGFYGIEDMMRELVK
ncbi:MAG: 4-hydroxy-tetrahydrodipicolinate reductase [Candidatus Diapherotrites archaeon]|nr:4-hydroxy-tetrahydrodipicolinate reductase [Candidatus Diapherotrites archaeon]